MKVQLDLSSDDLIYQITYASLVDYYRVCEENIKPLKKADDLLPHQKEDLKDFTKVRDALLVVLDHYTAGGNFLEYYKSKKFKKEFKND
jgi:hypothetical protein